MVVFPSTNIRLLKCPIEIDENNQITFNNLTNQFSYFTSLPHLDYSNCTYLRKDGVIRFETGDDLTYEDLIKYNYCMYQNDDYSDKWFYAFITDISYINDGTTDIKIDTDCYQSYMFDLTFKASFVEREMIASSSDVRGANLVPENLETGEYVSQFVSEFSGIGTSHVVMASNINPRDGTTPVSGGYYNNTFSGCNYYIFSGNGLTESIQRIADEGNMDSIVSLFYCPDIITGYNSATFTNNVADVSSNQAVLSSISVPLLPSTIDGYTPKNAKTFTYPYVSYVLSNNSGSSVNYHLEDFYNSGNNLGEIKVFGTCTPGCSIRAVPVNYRCKPTTLGNVDNNEYGLNLGKLPICSFPCDSYTNWLTQNGLNIATNVFSSALSMGEGAVSKNIGGITSGFMGIYNTLNSIYEHSFSPIETRGNINSGDVTFSIGKLTFTGYLMTVKAQFAEIIDNYFSMFGYQTNKLKVPNLNNRTNWNYVKTNNINLVADIPQSDLQKIKDMFNNGVTLWHNPSTFLDYSQNNN